MDTQYMGVHVCKELVLNRYTPRHRKHACAHNHFSHLIQAVSTRRKRKSSHWTFLGENSERVMGNKTDSVSWVFVETSSQLMVKKNKNKQTKTLHSVFDQWNQKPENFFAFRSATHFKSYLSGMNSYNIKCLEPKHLSCPSYCSWKELIIVSVQERGLGEEKKIVEYCLILCTNCI